MKYASLIAGEGDVVIGNTSFTFLNDVSIPHLFLYCFGIVLTSLLTFPSMFVAKGMNFPFSLLQYTTIVKDASFFELSWIEKRDRPSFPPNESTAPFTLSFGGKEG